MQNSMTSSAQQDVVVLVLANAPDILLAKRMAHLLIEEGLAACVSIGSAVLSIYSWKGEVEGAEEIPLIIKTTQARQAALIARLVALHPYEVPEALVIPVSDGHGPYLDWVRQLTKKLADPS
jgi:periplasmic divalent cation tolerance protein